MALGRTTGLIAKILALLPLFGCDEGPRTQVLYASSTGSYASLKDAALAGRSVPVYAVGAPFGSDGTLAEQVTGLLSRADRTLRFEAAGGGLPADAGTLKVLVLHDTPGGYTGISACQGKPYMPKAGGSDIEIRAIVCGPKGTLVEVLGVLPRDTPNLQQAYDDLLAQAVRSLLISEDKTPR
jgi:hypothetical protein